MRLAILTFIVSTFFLLAGCSTVAPESTGYSFGELSAEPGWLQHELFELQCQECSVVVESKILKVEELHEDWAPILGFTITSRDQAKSLDFVTIGSKHTGKYTSGIRIVQLPEEPAFVPIGDVRIGQRTRYTISWKEGRITVDHEGVELGLDLYFKPYSFGYLASGLTGKITLLDSNITISWDTKTPVENIPVDEVLESLSS